MAQLPEFNALTAAAQQLVTTQGLSFDAALAIATQNAADASAATQGDAGVLVVTTPKRQTSDHHVGRSPGPGQLPQFSSLVAQAQQRVIDRGMTFAQAAQIEAEIAASSNPALARKQRQSLD